MKNSRVERALLRDLARSVWKVVKTDDSFEVWFEAGFESYMREALRAIDSACDYGFGDLDNGSSFEISRFQSRDGKTHKFTVCKQYLIDWFGDLALDAYAKYSDVYYSNQEIEKELKEQQLWDAARFYGYVRYEHGKPVFHETLFPVSFTRGPDITIINPYVLQDLIRFRDTMEKVICDDGRPGYRKRKNT